MNKFFKTIRNIFSIEELRNRILYTLGILVVFRLGSFVVLPGVNPDALTSASGGWLGFIDIFLGGAFSRASIFALGIMPYISASIVIQLLTVAVPYFQKMQKEGESGRKRLTQITRFLTILICLGQSIGYIKGTISIEELYPGVNYNSFMIYSMIILTSGTIFTMWLGEKITDRGIGNGISMLIMIGIIARLPQSLIAEAASKGMQLLLFFILELVILFFVVMSVVLFTQAIRRIPVQYAKQVVGNKVYGGQRQYIPLRVNSAGVMPIIFAQSLMFIPSLLAGIWQNSSDFAYSVGATFANPFSWQYNLVFGVLILLFTFFYTAITVNPNQIADDLKRNGGFIPGVKPGKATSEYIDTVLTRVTLPGSIFLAIVAIFPAIANLAGVTGEFAQFYGGTSLLIMVGVILDTLQQIESYLLMRHYEGMMKSGKLRGRSQRAAVA